MIIETKDDVVRLLGSLHKNQWISIKAAAEMQLHDFPAGIIIDCAGLENISEDGAKTFLEGMRDIEAAKARIIVANLPHNLLSVCKSVPGVRSQLPLADSVEEARASLRLAARPTERGTTSENGRKGPVILVPLMADLDLTEGARLAAQLAKATKGEVRLLFLMEVARTLPLNAPLLEEEQAAQEMLNRALRTVREMNVPVCEYVEKVREATDGLLTAIKTHDAAQVVIGTTSQVKDGDTYDQFKHLVETLLDRAPCEVILSRTKRN